MSYKIYLIKHLDTDMKYVGITGGDLAARWEQHRADINSAVYKALRTEGYRMTMELLEEVATKPEALKKEQEYIRSLGTATPNGWNRKVYTPPQPKPKKWIKYRSPVNFSANSPEPYSNFFCCPACQGDYTHQENAVIISGYLTIYFWCESCHCFTDGISDIGEENPPRFEIHIYQHKGQTFFNTVYYIEDES